MTEMMEDPISSFDWQRKRTIRKAVHELDGLKKYVKALNALGEGEEADRARRAQIHWLIEAFKA